MRERERDERGIDRDRVKRRERERGRDDDRGIDRDRVKWREGEMER